jgi:hypothetical protein
MITQQQVTALTAQTAVAAQALIDFYVGEAYDDNNNLNDGWALNNDNVPVYLGILISKTGVGIYGQTPESLTLAGLLKPGALILITVPELTAAVLNTPAVWTGQFGINSLTDYLSYPVLQNLTQISLLTGAYQSLIDVGILNGNESARVQATFVQPAAQFGIESVINWVNNTADPDTVTRVKIAARQAQYAIDFVDTYSADLNTFVDVPGYTNTVDRTDVDLAVTEIIDNPKIPNIEYADAEVLAIDPITGAIIANVAIPGTTNEDGTFRFAPNNTTR